MKWIPIWFIEVIFVRRHFDTLLIAEMRERERKERWWVFAYKMWKQRSYWKQRKISAPLFQHAYQNKFIAYYIFELVYIYYYVCQSSVSWSNIGNLEMVVLLFGLICLFIGRAWEKISNIDEWYLGFSNFIFYYNYGCCVLNLCETISKEKIFNRT